MGTLASELGTHAERIAGRPRLYVDANVPAGLVAFMRTRLHWDVLFVIDVIEEQIAVKEAVRLSIPIMAIVDTNADPDDIDLVLPGNDDAIRTSYLVAEVIATAAKDGTALREARNKELAGAAKGADDESPAAEGDG